MENRCDRYRNDTNITGYGFIVQPRTEYQYVTHSRIKFHRSALFSTEFDTGSKHVGCGSGGNKTLIGYFERRLKFLYSSSRSGGGGGGGDGNSAGSPENNSPVCNHR